MKTTQVQANISPMLYAATTFQLIVNLLARLRDQGVMSEEQRVDLLNTVAAGLNPASNPQVQAMKKLLWEISGQKPI